MRHAHPLRCVHRVDHSASLESIILYTKVNVLTLISRSFAELPVSKPRSIDLKALLHSNGQLVLTRALPDAWREMPELSARRGSTMGFAGEKMPKLYDLLLNHHL